MKLRKKAIIACSIGITVILAACGGGGSRVMPAASTFKATTLVSNSSGSAPNTDPNLENGWGVAFNPTGPVWVSDNNTNKSSLYDGNGVVQTLVVTIPANALGAAAGPTGIVFNPSTGFMINANGGAATKAVFLWATEAGTIAAWAPTVLATQAVTAVDNSATAADYKGLAIGTSAAGVTQLYATDFHNHQVDVFNTSFAPVQVAGQFKDPNLPSGFSPFGIQVIGSTVYVSFAVVGPDGKTQMNGAGNGVVDAFDMSGNLLMRVATGGTLNSPWGMAMAPANFGTFSNDLLVGNFGAGTIDAFNPTTGAFVGALTQSNGSTFTQPGLWGMAFGNNVDSQPLNTLYFAAGPTLTSGIYGRLDLAQ
jgi:uncharacterized protein (TIGR03118 family)